MELFGFPLVTSTTKFWLQKMYKMCVCIENASSSYIYLMHKYVTCSMFNDIQKWQWWLSLLTKCKYLTAREYEQYKFANKWKSIVKARNSYTHSYLLTNLLCTLHQTDVISAFCPDFCFSYSSVVTPIAVTHQEPGTKRQAPSIRS